MQYCLHDSDRGGRYGDHGDYTQQQRPRRTAQGYCLQTTGLLFGRDHIRPAGVLLDRDHLRPARTAADSKATTPTAGRPLLGRDHLRRPRCAATAAAVTAADGAGVDCDKLKSYFAKA